MTYKRILVPVENSPYDAAILEHVRGLARMRVREGEDERGEVSLRRQELEGARAGREHSAASGREQRVGEMAGAFRPHAGKGARRRGVRGEHPQRQQ